MRVGFASAGATGVDNLEANGVAWLVLRSTGVLELHTPDAMVSEQLPGHSQVVNSLEHSGAAVRRGGRGGAGVVGSRRGDVAAGGEFCAGVRGDGLAHRDQRRPDRDGGVDAGDE